MSQPVITVRGLTKRYGATLAVDDVSFDVEQGKVTGFLGPNGAGKTTTMRVLVGLAPADAGHALVLGQPYRALAHPTRQVGTLLDGPSFTRPEPLATTCGCWPQPVASPRGEWRRCCTTSSWPRRPTARWGGFSLGMRRRLGLASALLGEPEVLVLDEPANGLDPAGIRWLRQLLRSFAAGGGTVFVSSHVLTEVAQTADEVVVVNRGRLLTHTPVDDLTAGRTVSVRTSDRERLRRVLVGAGGRVQVTGADSLAVAGLALESVGEAAAGEGLVVYELTTRGKTLEDVFLELVEEGAHRAAS